MLDLHRLRLLRELKHRGTLAAVAAALSYSPSSVSQQLSVLETEVGVPLLEPVGRRVRLTEQAEILVAHTEVVLERLERAEADIAASLTAVTGTLRIAAFQTAMLALIPPALTLLREEHPGLRVHVTQTEPETALPALLARDVDLVVDEEYPGDARTRPAAEVESAELCGDEVRLALPPDSAVRASEPSVALRALSGHPWVMEPAGTASRRWATTVCRQAGFEPDVRFESPDLLVQLRLVEEGHAAALLPGLLWGGRALSVPLLPLPDGGHSRQLFTAVRPGSGGHPAVRACRSALQHAAECARCLP
ncbi:LysR substrate-binding domain-containing protein [Streptomyces halobius]|uniref:LysR family transcriptional regulator n=1 Tax=Streptomyces halobius TaxID=2879846 RepID=A0ABY4M1D4_9ACTN|nr:LysR substrate-binding domain-containing protein [Streptomyces halobius]UQA90674.1 LysR family transcriptional regulator [Streptomyces halobius]